MDAYKIRQDLGKNVTQSPQLLLFSRSALWAQSLSESLSKLGWQTLVLREFEPSQQNIPKGITAVLVDQALMTSHEDLLSRLKSHFDSQHLPCLQIGDDHELGLKQQDLGLVLGYDAHPQQITLRLEHLTRAAVCEEEYDLRCQTFGDDLFNHAALKHTDGLKVLSVGQPSPRFMALNNALEARNIEVVATFSSYSAFDCLHENEFDGVVLWGGDMPSEALAIGSGMRRNSRLYHTPIILRLERNSNLDLGDAYLRGVTDIASASAQDSEISDRILALSQFYRRHQNLRKAMESLRTHPRMDQDTGLFSGHLFAEHLSRLSQAATRHLRPLSLCVLKLHETKAISQARHRKSLDRALPQIGSMIARLVRFEDTACRLSEDRFALALPATHVMAARQVGERICAVIGCTAFEAGVGRTPFVVDFDIGVAQCQPDEPIAETLVRASQICDQAGQALDLS